MDTEFSEEQQLLRTTVRRFLADRAPITPYVRSMLEDELGFSTEVWRQLADLGVMGLAVPHRFGGGAERDDNGIVDTGVVLEELGRMVHPGPYLSSAVGAVAFVLGVGSPEDHETYLRPLATGSLIATVCVPDRAAGVTATPAFEATEIDDNRWQVSGRASWVADANTATVIFAVAMTAAGPRAFVFDTKQPGVTIDVTETVDGTRRFATVTTIAAHARLLGTDSPPALNSSTLDASIERTRDLLNLGLVVDGIGAAARCLEMAVDYAKERHQFGVPIGSFQAVQHLCADMLVDLESARAGAYYALWAADQPDRVEFHRAATMAKAFSSATLVGIGEATIQVLGGIGFTWDHDAHLFYKRLLTLEQIGGDTTRHLEELAALILD